MANTLHYEQFTELPVSFTSVTVTSQGNNTGRAEPDTQQLVAHTFQGEMAIKQSGPSVLRSGEDYLEAYERKQLSCRRHSPGLLKAVPGWDTEAEHKKRVAVAQCLGQTSNGSEKINRFVALR